VKPLEEIRCEGCKRKAGGGGLKLEIKPVEMLAELEMDVGLRGLADGIHYVCK
jgi:hypothetical protein